MTRRAVASIAVLVAFTACAQHVESPIVSSSEPSADATRDVAAREADDSSSEEIGDFSKRRAMDHVRRLAGHIGVRLRATRGERRGARYVARELEELGYNVRIRTFEADSGTSRNVVGQWPGAKRSPVVVGAHMDTVARSPGANDNASGVAVVLEVARLFASAEQARFVKFVGFGSEEYGTDGRHHVGSQVFVNRLGSEGRRRLAGMVSVDMVADGRPLIVGTSGIGPEIVARALARRARRAGVAVDYRTLCDCSDNGPFEHAGIPAAFMWSGEEPDYHSASDTVANLVRRDLLRSGRVVRAFVKSLDLATIRRFRKG